MSARVAAIAPQAGFVELPHEVTRRRRDTRLVRAREVREPVARPQHLALEDVGRHQRRPFWAASSRSWRSRLATWLTSAFTSRRVREAPCPQPCVQRLLGLFRRALLHLEAERRHVHEDIALHPGLRDGGDRALDQVEAQAPQRGAHPIAFSRPAHSRSRSTNFWILPVPVRGSSPNSTAAGHLNLARCSLQKAMMSSSLDVLTGLQLDERLRALAPLLVRHRHDRDLRHRVVLGQRLLDLDARDVLPAGDDDVLRAVAQLDVAVGMPHGEVTGMEPAALEGVLGLLRLVVVAGEDAVAAHDHLADRLGVPRHVVHVLVDDADEVRAVVRVPLARQQLRLLVDVQLVPLRLPAAGHHRPVGLGQPVEVDRVQVELAHPLQQRRRGRRAAGGHRHVLLERMGALVVDDAVVDRRRAAVVGDALGLEELPDPLRLDPAQADVRGAGGRHAPGEAPAVAVEHRQRPEVDRVVAQLGLERDAERAQVGAAMRVDRALGLAGGARRVVDRDRLVLAADRRLDRVGRAGGQELLVGVVGLAGVLDHDHLEVVELDVLDERVQRRVDEQEARARVLEDVLELLFARARVHRDQHSAGERHAEVRLEQGRCVRGQDRDPLVLLQPAVLDRRGEPVAASLELRVVVAPLAVDHRRALPQRDRVALEERQRAELESKRIVRHLSGRAPRPARGRGGSARGARASGRPRSRGRSRSARAARRSCARWRPPRG